MKILILIQKWPGGQGVVATNLKRELEKRNNRVEVISREDDLNTYTLKRGIKKIRKLIRNEDYDILYTFDWSLTLSCLNMPSHFACFHGIETRFLSKFLQRFTGRILGKRLVVVGDGLKKIFPKSHLIYNGVDTKRFYNKKEKREYFGWIHKKTEDKSKEKIEEEAKKHRLSLLVAENIPYDEMNDFYNKLKVFVSYPSKNAGFNMCWLEAKSAGVPVILGNENGVGISRIRKLKKIPEIFTWKKHTDTLLEVFKQSQNLSGKIKKSWAKGGQRTFAYL